MNLYPQTHNQLRIFGMPPYLLGEIAEEVLKARLEGKEIVDLSQFNPNLGPPAKAVDALVQASLLPHNHRYSSSKGLFKLREALAEHYQEHYEVSLDVETEICMTMGTKEGLAHLLFSVISAGDSVILPTPAYPVHRSSVFLAGANCIDVPIFSGVQSNQTDLLKEENINAFFERLSKSIKRSWPRPRVMILNFPHNPTTSVVNQEFYQRLVDLAHKENLILINDFSYADICYDDYTAPSILSVEGAKEVAVEFYSLSKSFSVPGWRVGFCVGNSLLVEALKKIKSYLDFGLFQPMQIAAIEVLKDRDNKLKETRDIYQDRRNMFIKGLASFSWEVQSPSATPFVWAKIPDKYKGKGSLEFSKLLLREASVAVCPGVGFDEQADSRVRFTLVENQRMLQKALNNMTKFLLISVFTILFPVLSQADDCIEAASLVSAGTKLEVGSLDEAEAYEKAIKLCPKLSEAHYNLAVNLTEREKYALAIEKFNQALELSEGNSLYLLGLAFAMLQNKQHEKAEKVYNLILEQNPNELLAYEGLAYVYDYLARSADAERILLKAIKQNPNEATLYYNLAVIYENASEEQKALEQYKKAIEKKSNYAEAHLNLGKLYLSMGRLDLAERILNKASFLAANQASVWLVLAQLEIARANFSSAQEYLKKASELDGENVNVVSQQIVVLDMLGEREEAFRVAEEALKKFSSDSEIYSAYGWLSLRASKLDQAEKYLRKAISMNPSDAFTHNNLGVLFEAKGLSQSAKDSFTKALEIDPGLKEARDNLKRLG